MIKFISIQNSYKSFGICLFENNVLIDNIKGDELSTSKNLVILVDNLLKKNNLKINNLSFLALNQGPGAFITIRVVITFANALNFSTDIPLIGIDGLEATAKEFEDKDYDLNIVLLNAYNNEVYYAINKFNNNLIKGYSNIEILLKKIDKHKKILFLGNGLNLHSKLILNSFNIKNISLVKNIKNCSAEQVGLMALKKWLKNEFNNQLQPLYLKNYKYKKLIK